MGCRLRGHVLAADERRRVTNARFHAALEAVLAAEGLGELPPQTLGQLRADLTRLHGLRAELAVERRRRRDLLRAARLEQRTSGCLGSRIRRAA